MCQDQDKMYMEPVISPSNKENSENGTPPRQGKKKSPNRAISVPSVGVSSQKKVSIKFPLFSSFAPAPSMADVLLFNAFQETDNQHHIGDSLTLEQVKHYYPHAVHMLSLVPSEQQLVVAKFATIANLFHNAFHAGSEYLERADCVLAELISVLRPDVFAGESALTIINGMTHVPNRDTCLALHAILTKSRRQDAYHHAEGEVHPIPSTFEFYELYDLVPVLLYERRSAQRIPDIMSALQSLVQYPFDLSGWHQTSDLDFYIKSIPTPLEQREIARDMKIICTPETSDMNRAMIRNWLTETKFFPLWRRETVRQAAQLMNTYSANVRKSEPHQPTEILQALEKASNIRERASNIRDFSQDDCIRYQQRIIQTIEQDIADDDGNSGND